MGKGFFERFPHAQTKKAPHPADWPATRDHAGRLLSISCRRWVVCDHHFRRAKLGLEQSRQHLMKWAEIRVPCFFICFIGRLQMLDILCPILPQKLRQDWSPRERATCRNAKNIISGRSRSPAIAVDEWMDVVDLPKDPRSQGDRINQLPVTVHLIDEIVHERLNAKMRRRVIIIPYLHRARPILSGM